MTVNSLGYQSTKNPIAQSFFIDEASGIFLTKIKLYFKSTFGATADMQLPVSMHIRPMRNGMPSDVEIIPGLQFTLHTMQFKHLLMVQLQPILLLKNLFTCKGLQIMPW